MRENFCTIVCGMQGIGKTFTSREIIKQYLRKHHRPVLIFDNNDEFTEYKSIYYDADEPDRTIRAHGRTDGGRPSGIAALKNAEIRRIRPYTKRGYPLDDIQKAEAVLTCALYFRNGLFYLEDINGYIDSRSIPKGFYGLLTSMRHKGCDLIIQYQGITNPTTKIFQNSRFLRLHKTQDSVINIRGRVLETYDCLKIGENIINLCYDSGNIRYYIYIEIPTKKIILSSKIDNSIIDKAIEMYLNECYSDVKQFAKINRIKDEEAYKRLKIEKRKLLV